jgi:ABC-type glycerol-3-phosphate transport system substrate-binding protein
MEMGTRMNKRFAIVLALVACLAVGSISMATAKPKVKKVKTTVTLAYANTGAPPYNQSVFSGKVKAKKGCKKNRKVSIPNVGQTKSDSKGNYSIALSTAAAPGTDQATAKKKKITKNGTKIVCKKGKSNTVTVP